MFAINYYRNFTHLIKHEKLKTEIIFSCKVYSNNLCFSYNFETSFFYSEMPIFNIY